MNITNNKWVRRGVWTVVLVAVFAIGYSLNRGTRSSSVVEHGPNDGHPATWTCSMHPHIKLPVPGDCPICGMDLIPLETGASIDGVATLTLSEGARKLARITTALVERRSVYVDVRLAGTVELDERAVRDISAWVSGRITHLYVDFTGVHVTEGDPLFDLYSPELLTAQEALLQSVRAYEQLTQSSLASTRRSAADNVQAARDRLRLWGLSDEQISAIENSAETTDDVTITAPNSGVVLHKDAVEGAYVKAGTHVYTIADLSVMWLQLDVYEQDLAWVRNGQEVEFTADAYPGEVYVGTVSFVDPILNPRTRSVKVRVELPNLGGRLKPGMFGRAVLRAAAADGDVLPLVIPASAPLVTGTRAVVYVEDAASPGTYHGREITLGVRAGDFYVVKDGLREGERVVTNGNFKIDSALQIQARQSMMNPDGTTPPPTHDHGGMVMDEPRQRELAPATQERSEFQARMDNVLIEYFKISDALSHDDLATANAAANDLVGAIEAANEGSAPNAWPPVRAALMAAATGVANAVDIERARVEFFELSRRTIAAVNQFGTSGQMPVSVYHCPMARDGAGADWLQSKTGVENPYFGSSMFHCGAEEQVLVPREGN